LGPPEGVGSQLRIAQAIFSGAEMALQKMLFCLLAAVAASSQKLPPALRLHKLMSSHVSALSDPQIGR
jgi:hypothetical protein